MVICQQIWWCHWWQNSQCINDDSNDMWITNHFYTDHDNNDNVSEGGNLGDIINFDGGFDGGWR